MNTKNLKEKYVAYIGCYNCGWQDTVHVPKGITIKEYQKDKICPDCGCKMGGE